MNKICIVGVYFGKFKNYFSLWLKSCEYNSSIDFYIFTDILYEGYKPSNVHFINMTLTRLKSIASEKLNLNISLERPYKCCDLKPFYGTIFKDYMHRYEYWGHCDLDLIFGDVGFFLDKYNYSEYDKFLNLGHLSLYRNTDKVNHYYMLPGSKCGDYTTVLLNNESYAFDENVGIVQIYLQNKLPLFYKRIFADISHIYRRFKLSVYCSLDGKTKNYKRQIFYWEKGKVYRAYYIKHKLFLEEYAYIHFKCRPNFEVNFNVDEVDSFYITPLGFILKDKDVTEGDVDKYNPYPSEPFKEYIEFINWKTGLFMKRFFSREKRIKK